VESNAFYAQFVEGNNCGEQYTV